MSTADNSCSACQWMLYGCMPLSDIAYLQALRAVSCRMSPVCSHSCSICSCRHADPSCSLCQWMLTAHRYLSARPSSCRHAPELRHALFLAFILLLQALPPHPFCGSLPLLPVHSHNVYVGQLMILLHTRARQSWHGRLTRVACSTETLSSVCIKGTLMM